MDEAELITHAQQGSTAAWERLVSTYQEPVFRMAYLFLGDPDEAEDIAQETFIRAYYALPRFESALPLRPWLLRIASNLAKNKLRSIGRFFAALNRQLHEPEKHQASTEDADLLWQAIRRLEIHQRQALYLRYFMDLSEDEMAQALNIAPGTVKSRLHRAQAALRKIIIQHYPELLPGFEVEPARRGEV
jgi:RNA polymerase sigma-70 factor (ECF subfamily)